MKGPVTLFMRQKRGFTFIAGTVCDCKDMYRREFDGNSVMIMSYSPCKGGKPHRTCPGIYRFWRDGEMVSRGAMPMTATDLDILLKLLSLIPEDTTVDDVTM